MLTFLLFLLATGVAILAGRLSTNEYGYVGVVIALVAFVLVCAAGKYYHDTMWERKLDKVGIAEYYLDESNNMCWRIRNEYKEQFKKLDEKNR